VIRLRRPSEAEIVAHLASPGLTFRYPEVGATRDAEALERLAAEYDVDRERFELGRGRAVFEAARASLLAWRHFEIPWLKLHGATSPVQPGQVVATETRAAGLWFVNRCRVVYGEGLAIPADVAAFAYGTVTGHVERGEERFSVHFDAKTERVTYEILAFSRPAHIASRAGYPFVRRLQQRFRAASAEALARACRTTTDATPPDAPGGRGVVGSRSASG
jgi:uncharacterized protein (UPF0548 family)